MKTIPFQTLQDAKSGDIKAIQQIFSFFSQYIKKQCRVIYIDATGEKRTYINDEVKYKLETVLLDVIFSFEFRDPPDSFTG